MLPIVVVMIVILGLAGLVLAYVAYPHRGQELPAASWLGEAMGRAAEAAPTLDRSAEADTAAEGSHRGTGSGSGEQADDTAPRHGEDGPPRSFFSAGEDRPGFFR